MGTSIYCPGCKQTKNQHHSSPLKEEDLVYLEEYPAVYYHRRGCGGTYRTRKETSCYFIQMLNRAHRTGEGVGEDRIKEGIRDAECLECCSGEITVKGYVSPDYVCTDCGAEYEELSDFEEVEGE